MPKSMQVLQSLESSSYSVLAVKSGNGKTKLLYACIDRSIEGKGRSVEFFVALFLVFVGLARTRAPTRLQWVNQISYARFARQPTIRTFYLMFRPYDVILIISSPIRRTVQCMKPTIPSRPRLIMAHLCGTLRGKWRIVKYTSFSSRSSKWK